MKTPIRPRYAPLLAAACLVPLLGCMGSSSGSTYYDNATSVAVADLDGNGRMDVVTAYDRAYSDGTDGGFVSTRMGQGTTGIAFGDPIRSTGGAAPGPIVVANLDGNAQPDLVLCNAVSPTVTLLYGSATPGTFGSSVNLSSGRTATPTRWPSRTSTATESRTSPWPPAGAAMCWSFSKMRGWLHWRDAHFGGRGRNALQHRGGRALRRKPGPRRGPERRPARHPQGQRRWDLPDAGELRVRHDARVHQDRGPGWREWP